MTTSSTVLSDLAMFRKELCARNPDLAQICRLSSWRPLADTAFDWMVIIVAVFACHHAGYVAYPFALIIVANRQRALGNILHDAGHQNLSRNKVFNDMIARVFLAPALMCDLDIYRNMHFRHHAALGNAGKDPDLIAGPSFGMNGWRTTFLREVLSPTNFASSLLGHLARTHIGWSWRLYIVLWWLVLAGFVAIWMNTGIACMFVALWFTAKATVFHCITVFREMCDHFGLEPGGIYSFTRDIVSTSPWRWAIHPRNNAYHLTHHLMPSVPYYQLPVAQKIFAAIPSYAKDGVVCKSYFRGHSTVIRNQSIGTRFTCSPD